MDNNKLLQVQISSIKSRTAEIENQLTFLGQIFDAASNREDGKSMVCGEDGEGLRGLSSIIFDIRERAYQTRLLAGEMIGNMDC